MVDALYRCELGGHAFRRAVHTAVEAGLGAGLAPLEARRRGVVGRAAIGRGRGLPDRAIAPFGLLLFLCVIEER